MPVEKILWGESQFWSSTGSKRTKPFGFTLVELIVVITILAILATIGFLALSGYSQDAKDSAIKANVRSVQTTISAESAVTGNSPRYYVVHDTGAALSGAFVYVDGTQTPLTGGNLNQTGTNYTAGNPDYVKLKMNPEKFKVSKLGEPLREVLAAYNSEYLSVGALDILQSGGMNGAKRAVSWFQVVGVSPATGISNVSGNFPTNMSGSVNGLVRDPALSATGALTDGAKGGTVTSDAVTGPANDFFKDGSQKAFYKFENDATDALGSYNGTPSWVSYVSGKYGQAASFGDAKNFAIPPALTWATAATFSFWVNPSATTPSVSFLGFNVPLWNAAYQRGFSFYYNYTAQGYGDGTSTANNSFHIYNAGNTNSDIAVNVASTALNRSAWNHVAFVFAQPNLDIYVNGTKVGTATHAAWTKLTNFSTTNTNWILGDTVYTANTSDANFDNVRIFNRALSASEITALSNE